MRFPQRRIITEKIHMIPNTAFINVGHFWIQWIFQKTSLQILSDSDGVVMRFGTKIFIFTGYVYSQILRLHANCAYAFWNVKENHPQNTSEKFSYTSISLTLRISQFWFHLLLFLHTSDRIACVRYILFFCKLFILTVPFNELHTRAHSKTHTLALARTHTHVCPRSYQIWSGMTSSGEFMHYKTHRDVP